jgi:uncharacterized alkaline shock family protein YloU
MKMSSKEIQYPETIFEREVGMKAFRSIVLRTLTDIPGVYFLEEDLVDSILGRESYDGIKGIHVSQVEGQPALEVEIHLCLESGLPIPVTVEKIQNEVVQALVKDTGLHVSRVQVVVEDVRMPAGWAEKIQKRLSSALGSKESV